MSIVSSFRPHHESKGVGIPSSDGRTKDLFILTELDAARKFFWSRLYAGMGLADESKKRTSQPRTGCLPAGRQG